MATSPQLRTLIHDQGGKCYYCQLSFTRHGPHRPTRDHYLPQWAGGGEERDNLVAACARCNGLKGPMHPGDFAATRSNPVAYRVAYNWALAQSKAASHGYPITQHRVPLSLIQGAIQP